MTAALKIKNGRYYAVINYKAGEYYKQKWVALGLPAKNNKRKAESMLDEIKEQYASIDHVERDNASPLFADYIRSWVKKKMTTVEKSTWEGYYIYANKHIIPYFEPMRLHLEDVKPRHIADYYQDKYVSGRLDGKPGGLSIPSIKKHSIVIKEALDDAVLAELIPRNPAVGVKMPAKNTSKVERKFLTVDEANELLRALEGHILQALVYVTLYYGLRRSEVLGLKWDAIDFDRGTLTIKHTVVKNLTVVAKDAVKTQASFHTYDLIDDVKLVLLNERERQARHKADLASSYNNTGYVFVWDDGTPLRPDYVTRGFQRVLKNSGLPPMRFHDLRHSTASILFDKGWNLKDIQSWLRHASIDVTSDIYTHITEDRKARMASELNSTFIIDNKEEQNETGKKN